MSFGNHQALVASTVATVSVTGLGNTLEIVNRNGTAEVFVSFDQSTPTVAGAGTVVIPAAAGSVRRFTAAEVNALAGKWANNLGTVTVKAISVGTPSISVHAW